MQKIIEIILAKIFSQSRLESPTVYTIAVAVLYGAKGLATHLGAPEIIQAIVNAVAVLFPIFSGAKVYKLLNNDKLEREFDSFPEKKK
jgi:hypothetical protein